MGPPHLRDFAAPLARQDQQLGHRAERIALGVQYAPYCFQFGLGQNAGTRAVLGWLFHLHAWADRDHVAIHAPSEQGLDNAKGVVGFARLVVGYEGIEDLVDVALADVTHVALLPCAYKMLVQQALCFLGCAGLVAYLAVARDERRSNGIELERRIIDGLLGEGRVCPLIDGQECFGGFGPRIGQGQDRIAPECQPAGPAAMPVHEDERLGARTRHAHAKCWNTGIPDFEAILSVRGELTQHQIGEVLRHGEVFRMTGAEWNPVAKRPSLRVPDGHSG